MKTPPAEQGSELYLCCVYSLLVLGLIRNNATCCEVQTIQEISALNG